MSPSLTLLCRSAGYCGGWQLTTHCLDNRVPLPHPSHSPLLQQTLWPQAKQGQRDIVSFLFKKCFPIFIYHTTYGILFPRPRIESMPPAVEAPSLNHWTTREASLLFFFLLCHLFCGSLQDLSSLTRDGIPAQLQWKPEILTIRPPGYSLPSFLKKIQNLQYHNKHSYLHPQLFFFSSFTQ